MQPDSLENQVLAYMEKNQVASISTLVREFNQPKMAILIILLRWEAVGRLTRVHNKDKIRQSENE